MLLLWGKHQTFIYISLACVLDPTVQLGGRSEGATEMEISEVGGSNRVTCSVK
jgi:hypothetical protein